MIVGVLKWSPVVKPLVVDVIHHPLSYLAGLQNLKCEVVIIEGPFPSIEAYLVLIQYRSNL